MRTKRRRLAERPEIILDAANAVLRQGGARSLTIDAVAAAAGLSKGGVLHHYASKDALILALVARKLGSLREEITACEAEAAPGPGRLPRAMVAHLRRTYAADDETSRALLLAAIESPEALEGYRSFVADCLDRLAAEGGRAGGYEVLFFAILGLIMGRELGFHELGADDVGPVLDALDRVAGAAKAGR